jgi:hypothetical protein
MRASSAGRPQQLGQRLLQVAALSPAASDPNDAFHPEPLAQMRDHRMS